MSLSERYQERRDQLLEHLGLTDRERLFIANNYQVVDAAGRMARLLRDYVEQDSAAVRRELMRLLVGDAVPDLRAAMAAMDLVVPEGYVLLSCRHLGLLQEVVGVALDVCAVTGKSRDSAVSRLREACSIVRDCGLPGV